MIYTWTSWLVIFQRAMSDCCGGKVAAEKKWDFLEINMPPGDGWVKILARSHRTWYMDHTGIRLPMSSPSTQGHPPHLHYLHVYCSTGFPWRSQHWRAHVIFGCHGPINFTTCVAKKNPHGIYGYGSKMGTEIRWLIYLHPRKNTNKCSFERFLLFGRFFSIWA